MLLRLSVGVLFVALTSITGIAQEYELALEGDRGELPPRLVSETFGERNLDSSDQGEIDFSEFFSTTGEIDLTSFSRRVTKYETTNILVRAQSADDGGPAGAAAATDPSVPLTQFQLQASTIPSTYSAEGTSNTYVVQPVIPLNLNWDFLPYHIIRPTLPIISPSANPDGPVGQESGLGDLTILDVYIHPFKEIKTNVGLGPIIIAPTSSKPELGLGEWQLGPSMFVVNTAVPKWNLGFLAQAPFSMESDAYTIQFHPIAVRMLPDNWYVGTGDLLMTLDNQNGGYEIPLSMRIGKVVKCGEQPFNIFLQPQYTPSGFQSGGKAEWGIKLNVTLMMPKVHLTDPILAH